MRVWWLNARVCLSVRWCVCVPHSPPSIPFPLSLTFSLPLSLPLPPDLSAIITGIRQVANFIGHKAEGAEVVAALIRLYRRA